RSSDLRVFEVQGNLASARASYFHKSLGGYHAAKPKRLQELFDYQISNNNLEILNMLNVKYLIQVDEQGQEFPVQNPDANGNAWFVGNVKFVNSADAEMKALDSLDSKTTAIINRTEFKEAPTQQTFATDSSAQITLDEYTANYLKYTSTANTEKLAVFSEIYYPKGWNAY